MVIKFEQRFKKVSPDSAIKINADDTAGMSFVEDADFDDLCSEAEIDAHDFAEAYDFTFVCRARVDGRLGYICFE